MQPVRDLFPATTWMVQEDVNGLVRTLDRAFERTVKRQAVLPLKEQLNRIENPLRWRPQRAGSILEIGRTIPIVELAAPWEIASSLTDGANRDTLRRLFFSRSLVPSDQTTESGSAFFSAWMRFLHIHPV
jgi:hypothetical protein